MSAVVSLRRIILLVVLAAAGGVVLAWLRDRTPTPVPAAPPQWPPLPDRPDSGDRGDQGDQGDHGVPAAPAWRGAAPDGSCPTGFPVKVKQSSGIYHVPDGRFYERTHPDRCYTDPSAAEADGYRRSKS